MTTDKGGAKVPAGYWEQDDDARSYAERLEPGLRFLRVSKTVFGKGKGDSFERFESQSGHPQVMLVLQDREGKESTLMLTCSAEAGWMIRKTASALGNDMGALGASGLTPQDFALAEPCAAYLKDRWGWFNGTQGNKPGFVNWDPVKAPKAAQIKKEAILRAGTFDEASKARIDAGEAAEEVALAQATAWVEAERKMAIEGNPF